MIYKEGLLKGKVALVTGANRGLGYAMCVGLAENGADIFNIGHGDDANIREAIEKIGRGYHYMKADLSKPTKALTDAIVAEVVNVYGHLDILLNNAGVNRRAPFLEYAEADWDYTLNLNLKQVFLPQISVPMRRAFFAERRSVPLEESVGCIAAVPAGAYPPGTPAVLPGQKITEDMVDYLILLKNRGYSLFGIYRNEIEIACI